MSDVKNMLLVALAIYAVIATYTCVWIAKSDEAAYAYIQELEEFVEDNGGLDDTVGSGDAYANYYHIH